MAEPPVPVSPFFILSPSRSVQSVITVRNHAWTAASELLDFQVRWCRRFRSSDHDEAVQRFLIVLVRACCFRLWLAMSWARNSKGHRKTWSHVLTFLKTALTRCLRVSDDDKLTKRIGSYGFKYRSSRNSFDRHFHFIFF